MTDHSFALPADLSGRAGNAIETRVWWNDRAWIRVGRISVYGRSAE